MSKNRLATVVAEEGLLWGADVAIDYHLAAGRDMDSQWNNIIWPLLVRHNAQISSVVELACGYGRNSVKLLESGTKVLTLVDVNPDNISYCKEHITKLGMVIMHQNNGVDLSGLGDQKYTLVYTFDSMVHFDMELVISYVAEFARILFPGGIAFIHHSNYTGSPGDDFRTNPSWRNFMSATIMRHVAKKNGLEVLEQKILDWGGTPEIDCISVLRKPL